MRFAVNQDSLQNELQFLQGVAEKKKTIPILSNIRLQADEGFLKLAATDLEVSLTGGCESTVAEVGGITVSAKKLFEIVRSLPPGQISFELADGNWLELRCGKAFFRLVGLPLDDFPEVPEHDFDGAAKIDHHLFKVLIGRTLFAVTQEDARYALNGALLEMGGGTIRMVATDAHRLALVERPLAGGAPEVKAIVPKKTLSELRNLGNGEEMLFGQDEHHLYFKIGHRILATRVIEGQFPSYEKVIPSGNPLAVSFDRAEMEAAIRRVSLLASERSRAIRLKFAEGEATVSSSNPEMGEARESVAIQYDQEEIEISFNAQYIIDFLSVVESDRVVFELKDQASQGLLLPEGDEEDMGYKYVVMPMRM